MANLFQLLSNVKNKISNLGGAQGLTPYERLFGQQAPSSDDVEPKGVDTSSPYYKESMGEEAPLVNITASQNPRVGGIFNDIVNGYRENRTTPISMNNFGDNNIDFNRTKGLSYRIGEGLGSVGRFIDSPLGRGVLTGAAVAALGGAPGEVLAYGGTATTLNQGNRGRDALYRQQLQKEGIDTSGINGYITDSTYKSMLEAKQLKDNAEYRNAYLAQQKVAQDEAREDRKLERELRRQENAANRALTARGQNMSYDTHMANLDLQREKLEQAEKAKRNADEYGDIQAQLNNFASMFETVNNPYRYRVFGGASEKFNTLTKEEANFNAQRTLLFNQIARKLSGEKGVLSDKDIARVESALPSLSDTLEQKRAKMRAIYALLDIKQGSANQAANNIGASYNDGWAF